MSSSKFSHQPFPGTCEGRVRTLVGGATNNCNSDPSTQLIPDNLEDINPQVDPIFRTEALALIETYDTYDVEVVRRRALGKPTSNEDGTFYQETVRYSDGAVRAVTIGVPYEPNGEIPISSGDPLFTGKGFNEKEIKQMVSHGFYVVWNHHQGRHSLLPTSRDRIKTLIHATSSKSIGHSTAQDHALLDDLSRTAPFKTEEVIAKGYSRSGMKTEALIVLGGIRNNSRNVVWSDVEAECFAKGVGVGGLAKILLKQAPHEGRAILKIAQEILSQTPINDEGDTVGLFDYKDTFDPHPLNVLHELAWIKLLINGDAGLFAKALPLDTKGLRTFYEKDFMSQQADLTAIHKFHPNIQVIEESGAHLSGATPTMLRKKDERYKRLAAYIRLHDGDLSSIMPSDIIESPKNLSKYKAKLKVAA